MSTSTTVQPIAEDWRCWLQENLACSVPSQTLLQVMVEKGFEPDEIRRCIASIQSKPPAAPLAAIPQADHLIGDWQQWVIRNIEKGVLESTLIDAASREIRAAWAQRNEALRLRSESQGYRYESAPTPQTGLLQTTDGRTMPILMRLDQPRLVLYANVLSPEECEALIALGRPRVVPSQTNDHASAQLMVSDVRRSNGSFFKRGENELVQRLEQRFAELTQWPMDHGEGLQLLQYHTGGEYTPHFDFFPPESPASQIALRNGGQRVATLIVYLQSVEEGGETYFPKLNLKIKPEQGNALYFSYTNAHNELDRMTLHGGAPVTRGEKWILTQWMRQRKFR